MNERMNDWKRQKGKKECKKKMHPFVVIRNQLRPFVVPSSLPRDTYLYGKLEVKKQSLSRWVTFLKELSI
jgi:hypothetical protein